MKPSTTRKVETYAWKGLVSRGLHRLLNRAELTHMLRSQLEHQVEREGYVPMADTFSVQYIDHRDPEVDPLRFSAKEREALDRSDAITVRTQIRCYRAVTS